MCSVVHKLFRTNTERVCLIKYMSFAIFLMQHARRFQISDVIKV